MNKTGIEWCSMTWNCLRGCSWASLGCDHCYAETIAKRFGKPGQPYEGTYDYSGKSWSGEVMFVEKKLDEPLKVKAPQLVFANSMSDVCHPHIDPEWVKAIMEIIAATQRHFYMFLTKRPNLITQKVMPGYLDLSDVAGEALPNVAFGTSIEHPAFLFRGFRLLEQWPGSCFLSVEPLLSRLSIKELLRAD
jgi:protein gp37